MELWIGALNLGFLYAIMAAGVLISYRILNFPDITTDGSFTAGASVTAVLIVSGTNPYLALIAGFLAGAAAGICTGLIHTRMKINGLLSGILVFIGLYSINLRIMGRSNIPLLNLHTVISGLNSFNPGLEEEIWLFICISLIIIFFWIILSLFFKTDLGITIRATGDNRDMALASGVNVNYITILGLALANGLIGVSGGLVAQYQGFSDIGMGIGTLMIGLASVIIGESIFKKSSVYIMILSVIAGSLIYRMMIALALHFGMNPVDLKLFTALFVLLTLHISRGVPEKTRKKRTDWLLYFRENKKLGIAAGMIAIILLFIFVGDFDNLLGEKHLKFKKIGVVQMVDNGLLNVTRDSFAEEIIKLGYVDGKNCEIDFQNAQGDMSTVNTILDKFVMQEYDIIFTLSSSVTLAAINKIDDIPIVFSPVANPFILKAGTSETEHLPNVTGVYGWAPMDETLEIVRTLFPGKIKIGAMGDPAQVNSVFNMDNLEKAVAQDENVILKKVLITNSSEVYQCATSLTKEDIDMFVLPPDNIVYSAFESIVKAGNAKNIPICINDIERLPDGALIAYGYDYTTSGIQAAHLIDRILKGEDPKDIPFERYKKIDFGINLKVVEKLNVEIPESLMKRATIIVKEDGTVIKSDEYKTEESNSLEEKRLVIFRFNDNNVVVSTQHAMMEELEKSKILEEKNISIDIKSAQGDFANTQAIGQIIVQNEYDYIITLSTPTLQTMAQLNKKIPHIFGAVTDPYRAGVAKSPEEHPDNMTGLGSPQPLDYTFKTMREIFPEAKKVGIIWNPAEACSEACMDWARPAAEKYDFELLEVTVAGTNEVTESLNSLLVKDIDIFLTSGDNTVMLTQEAIAEILKKKKIPYFTNNHMEVENKPFMVVGTDFKDIGRETALVAQRVIKGENPADIPIETYGPEKLYINLTLAKEFGIDIPQNLIEKASEVW